MNFEASAAAVRPCGAAAELIGRRIKLLELGRIGITLSLVPPAMEKWVVLMANIIAMLYRALSAKLGIVTGRNLAEMCREHFPQPVVWALWIISEIAAMATDEFLGGAIGLSLLLHIPLVAGMGVTADGLLMFEGRGFRPIELIIGALAAAIALCYLAEMLIAPIYWGAAGVGSVVPLLPDAGAVTIAVGIVGATIMPHAISLHSGLTQNRAPARNDGERRQLLKFSNIEVLIALAVAGLRLPASAPEAHVSRIRNRDAAARVLRHRRHVDRHG